MPDACSQDLIDFAEHLADAAGAVIRPHFRTPVTIDKKSDNTPVTIADRDAEAAMRALIAETYPEHGIIGEEFGQHQGSSAFTWVLDPIDGTKSFISGRPIFGTLIALTRDGLPILGIIDQPILGERWIGSERRTTLFNGEEIATRPCPDLSDAMANSTSPDLFSGTDAEKFARISDSVWHMQFGGDCYAYGTLAMGCLDIIVEVDLKPYDFCALAPIVNGAGGIMTDWAGQPLTVASDGRVAAAGDPALMPAMINLLSR
jgi:inositol-phosphate phosphatase/L-galactose 1-phosphate phosphatase/histidinol-phosphatase